MGNINIWLETNVPIDSPDYSQGLSSFMLVDNCLWPMVMETGMLILVAMVLLRLTVVLVD